jgi:hypothetical protein
MQDIWVSLHSIHSSLTTSSCDTPFKIMLDTRHHRHEASLRSARLQGLLEVGPARLIAAMVGDLGVFTLRLIMTMTQFFFTFLSIKPAMLPASMLGDYSTSASSTPSCFLCRTDLLGNPFLITSLLDLLFLLFFLFGSSYRPSCPSRCSETTL